MAHMQYYLRALQNEFSCKIFSISIQSLLSDYVEEQVSGTNYILNKPEDVGQYTCNINKSAMDLLNKVSNSLDCGRSGSNFRCVIEHM